jgi:hypothetical protein
MTRQERREQRIRQRQRQLAPIIYGVGVVGIVGSYVWAADITPWCWDGTIYAWLPVVFGLAVGLLIVGVVNELVRKFTK